MEFLLSIFYFLVGIIAIYELMVITNHKKVADIEKILDHKSNELSIPSDLILIVSFYVIVNIFYILVVIFGLFTPMQNYFYMIILFSILKRVIFNTSWGFKNYDMVLLIDAVLTFSVLVMALDHVFDIFNFQVPYLEEASPIDTYKEDI